MLKDWVTIEKIIHLMEDRPLFIADGHHRYQVCLAYRDEMKEPPQAPSHYTMMMLVSMNDPGLCILPIHRVFRIPKKLERGVEDIVEESFYIEPLEEGSEYQLLREQMEKGPEHTFGLYVGRNKSYYLLSLQNRKDLERNFPKEPECLRELDVNVLHSMILDKVLGGRPREENNIRYVHDVEETLRLVNSGEYDMAFFLNPTTIEQVKAVASRRIKMPPKSTFFYPKLLSGMVINCLELPT